MLCVTWLDLSRESAPCVLTWLPIRRLLYVCIQPDNKYYLLITNTAVWLPVKLYITYCYDVRLSLLVALRPCNTEVRRLACVIMLVADVMVNVSSLATRFPPVGSGTPAFRLGSRIDPHRHRGVVKVHWRVPWVGGLFSWVVATFTL